MHNLVHVSLCGPVTDGFGYQDNLLPKYHKKLGFDVTMITSEYIYNSSGDLAKDSRKSYFNDDGVKVIRLKSNKNTMNAKFKKYSLLKKSLIESNADVLFIHGVQFFDIKTIVDYIQKHKKIEVFVDNHADFNNSARNLISKYVIHKIFWKKNAKKIEPFVKYFYGVTPARCDFLIDMYDLPKSKIKLLNLGIDDEILQEIRLGESVLLKKILSDSSKYKYIISSGGKFDSDKMNIINFIKAFKEVQKPDILFIFFGSISKNIQKEITIEIENIKNIKFLGWLSYKQTIELFNESDLVLFTGKHSVMWEQAFSIGKPLLVNYSHYYNHLNFSENMIYTYSSSTEEYKNILNSLFGSDSKIKYIKNKAIEIPKENFYYSNIASKSISRI